MPKPDLALEKGLPCNVDAERFCLGSILLNDAVYPQVAGMLDVSSFSLRSHQLMYARMKELYDRGARIDRIILADELTKHGLLEAVGGLEYIVSLDDGLPEIVNIDAYVRIVKDKALLRTLIFSSQEVINRCLLATDDPREIISFASKRLTAEMAQSEQPRPRLISEFVDTYAGGLPALLDPNAQDAGLSTGFKRIDEMTGGFHSSEIFIVGARPGSGKSSFLVNIAKNVAKTGKRVIVFSLEMPARQVFHRMICEESGISMKRFRKGELSADERRVVRESAAFLYDLPILIDDTSGLKPEELALRLKIAHDKDPVSLCCVDFVQLMRCRNERENENARFTEIANTLQELAKSTGIPLLLAAQLNRDSEKRTSRGKRDPRPRKEDIRGSGTWEQIANVIIMIFREYLSDQSREDLKYRAELIVDKNRDGDTGVIQMGFRGWKFQFEDLEEAGYEFVEESA